MSIHDVVSGEPCPRCGCRDTRAVGTSEWFGRPQTRLECRHCGRTFNSLPDTAEEEREAGPVAYEGDPTRCTCPSCRTRNPPVYRTIRKGSVTVRYHRCTCGHRFRSEER